MSDNWKSYENAAEKGPLGFGFKVFFALFAFGIVVSGVLWFSGFFADGAKVISDQLSPSAIQVKYEWFKDCSAQLDAKAASIGVFEAKLKSLEEAYKGQTRNQWTRDDRQEYSLSQTEVAGIKASFNSLAAEYNAAMSKWNYRFANKGQLPAGAETPLPREYKPYISK